MKNIVYGLADSRNDLIYYVGKSSVGSKRALQHLSNSHSKEVNEWIKEVEDNWGKIKVIVIEEVVDLDFLAEREKHWIGIYSDINENLLNKNSYPKLINSYSEEDDRMFSSLKNSIVFSGDIIKKRRLSLNITQSELAKESKVNRWTISQVENNSNISLTSLKKIILGLTKIGMDKNMKFSQIKGRASNR